MIVSQNLTKNRSGNFRLQVKFNLFSLLVVGLLFLYAFGSSQPALAAPPVSRDLKNKARDSKNESDVPSMDDLATLRDQKKWPQLSAQLERVPSALRTDEWKKMLNLAALALTDGAESLEVPTQAYLEADDLLIRYPDLVNNDEFMRRRRVAGLKFFDNCFQNKNNLNICTSRLKSLADVDPNDSELQFGTGKLIRAHVGTLDAIPYFERAMMNHPHEGWCKDSDVKIAATTGLQLPAGKQGENADAIRQSLHIAFNVCWSDWQEILLELYAKDKVHYQHNVCNQLRSRGVLTPAQNRQCPHVKKEN